ncbi:MAG: metal-dependent transcriptional regulator [Clostridia bacterium]|nr:metal-dependent transcriptional regulator [Clostridia bacterium]
MHIQESGEMYLETIHVLSKKNGSVRAIDISEYMGYSKPSVSRAMSILKGADYIEVDEHGYITLTDTGLEIANKMYERHTLLTEFLIRIGVDKETAADDACKIEHHISEASFEAIKKFAESENRK